MLSSFWPRRARRGQLPASGTVGGVLRVDRRTKDLCGRLRRGEIALIDHRDLDATAARALVEIGPSAVVNAAASITGRYPNAGPQMLLEAGIPLLDEVGSDALDRLRDGAQVELREDGLWVAGERVASGTLLTKQLVGERMEAGRRNLDEELRRFSENTLQYLASERSLAVADLSLPELDTRIQGRPALIVVRGEGHKEDLGAARSFIREQRPVLIAVDGGADALLEAGFRPDLIVGDMDSASDGALRCGAELLMHAYPDGRGTPARARIERLGLQAKEVAGPGMSEDLAMQIAYQDGADLIVAVGTHFSLIEFLDKRRLGMASTFLTRLKVGSILVDAKGLSRLYRPAIGFWPLSSLIASGCLFIAVLAVHSPAVQRWLLLVAMHVEVWLRRYGLS